MKKRIILILIVLAAVGVAAVCVFRGMGRNQTGRIVVSGNIELTEVNIAFKTAGRLIERTVDEGDGVKKGQIIARLDRDQLMAQRQREVAGLESAQTQLAQSETSLAWEKATLAADIEQRRADLGSNEARLAELNNGARPQEKLDAHAAVDVAQSELDRAKRDWDRSQTLYKNDDISTAQFDQYRNRWESAQAAVKSATEREALVLAGPRADVTTDSYPGKVYQGRVTFISSEAEFTPKQIQTEQERVKLVYRIKIELDNPRRELKSNMPADAEIVLD